MASTMVQPLMMYVLLSCQWLKALAASSEPKNALVFLAQGFEDIEFTVQVDVLRRAKVNVTVVSIEEQLTPLVGLTGTKITPDALLKDFVNSTRLYDLLSLPGGGAAKSFAESEDLKKMFKAHNDEKKLIAAICLSPVAFNTFGINYKKRITSWPSAEERLSENYEYRNESVVVDGNMITSRGPGTSFPFAFMLVEKLVSLRERRRLEKMLLFT